MHFKKYILVSAQSSKIYRIDTCDWKSETCHQKRIYVGSGQQSFWKVGIQTQGYPQKSCTADMITRDLECPWHMIIV